MSTEAKMESQRHTLVEEGTEFKGSLSSKCPIVVKGKVDGDVQAPALAVSQSGAVHGAVKVKDLTSRGELSGELHADTMHLSGVVRDNTVLRAQSLEVKLGGEDGGLVFGECTLEVGDPEARRETGKTVKDAMPVEAATPAEVAPAEIAPQGRRDKKKRPQNDDVAAAAAMAEVPGGILTERTPTESVEPSATASDGAPVATSLSQPPPAS